MSTTAAPTSQTAITGVDFVCVPTADFDRATAFYGDVLGLRQSAQWGSMPAAEFETGSLILAIMQAEAFGQEFRPNCLPIALRVTDIAAARAQLDGHGVEFSAAFDSGVCHQAVFHDPDGNPLVLHERYAPRS